MSAKELEGAGVKVMAMPGAKFFQPLRPGRALKLLKKHGRTCLQGQQFKIRECFDLSGLQEYRANEEKYLPRKRWRNTTSRPGI